MGGEYAAYCISAPRVLYYICSFIDEAVVTKMLKPGFDPSQVYGYHAHIYYKNDTQRAHAALIREALSGQFSVDLGRWRDEPVGPHPLPMYQVAFEPALLLTLIPWLQAVRGDLSILVHQRTDQSDLLDHTLGAFWLGEAKTLDLEFFRRGMTQA